MALTSALSMRAKNPDVPVCVINNLYESPSFIPWWNSDDVWIYLSESTDQNRCIKTNLYRHTPFEKTLYLDCDTLVLDSISDVWFFLDSFDIALKHSLNPGHDGDIRLFGQRRLADTGHFNGGVIGFKQCEAVADFFNCWNDQYIGLGLKRDQPALVRAIFGSKVRVFPLPKGWNRGDDWAGSSSSRANVRIWHYKTELDRRIERYLVAVASQFPNGQHAEQVTSFIRRRRKSRGHAKSPRWFLRSVVVEIRGPLSRLPQSFIEEALFGRAN
jgi:hypothetical protein